MFIPVPKPLVTSEYLVQIKGAPIMNPVMNHVDHLMMNIEEIASLLDGVIAMVPLTLYCPKCQQRHIDLGEWATRPHKTHLCAHCGHTWRPYDFQTVGV